MQSFLITRSRLHSALKFTFEKEHDGKLPFLDILVERTELGFETSEYRKPTLVHRALVICTKNKLKQEIDFIKKILLGNG